MLHLQERSIRVHDKKEFKDINNNNNTMERLDLDVCLNPSTKIVLRNTEVTRNPPQRGKRRGSSTDAAPTTTTTTGASGRRGSGSRAPIKPLQRNAANARERCRMRVLSKAFTRLKTSLPWVPPDTKLSKLDTLRLASSYISHLRKILEDDTLDGTMVHPLNLTWPFAISSRPVMADDTTSEECEKEGRSDTASDVMSESP
ncbi:transcription factor 21-like [Asterias rubens]|uniref:transcription factor 21-like n=1 Tax=Asterias rubens TaxID=7604 RepID=UPI00145513DA|nr:transcription factor 21-like [Asterias rubens]